MRAHLLNLKFSILSLVMTIIVSHPVLASPQTPCMRELADLAYSISGRIPFYNLINNGFPWRSRPVLRTVDKVDIQLWNLSDSRNQFVESASWELLDSDGNTLDSIQWRGTAGYVDDQAIYLNKLTSRFVQTGGNPSKIATIRSRHVHPSDPDGMPWTFSGGDRLFAKVVRNQVNKLPALKHVDLEYQIIYNSGNGLAKKSFILPTGRPGFWLNRF